MEDKGLWFFTPPTVEPNLRIFLLRAPHSAFRIPLKLLSGGTSLGCIVYTLIHLGV